MTDEVTTNSPDTLKVVSSSLGKALSTARIAKNLSLKEVSKGSRKIALDHPLIASARSLDTSFGDKKLR